jgi:DNA-binding NarL/FixJ family response regulator
MGRLGWESEYSRFTHFDDSGRSYQGARVVVIRILMADDFVPWRRFVSSILQKQSGWQVACEGSDGLEAVQKAEELKPDLILLDIGLAKLNGIEAARQIRKLAANSKILFLSAYGSPDIAREALNTGACGYVVKSDAGSELLTALEAVFQGKRFVSSRLKGRISVDAENTQNPDHLYRNEILAAPAPTLPRKAEILRCHEVQFYSDDAVFLERVTHFIAAALKAGNPAIAFATEPHRISLLQRLKAQGVDVDAGIRNGTYISLDAADTLSTFMVNDWPDRARFLEGFSNLIATAAKAAKAEPARVAIFGEGVALLWAKGKRDATIRLEQLGNDLAKTHDVDILCAYPLSSFLGEEDKQVFKTICAEHSAAYSL